MPGGEEFDATLVEALFMNELLALNDLVSNEYGTGGGVGGTGGDVTSGFEGLAGLLGNSVGPTDDVDGSGDMATGCGLAPLPGVAGQTPPMLPSSPVLSGGAGASGASAAASEILPGTISDISPLRPNRPHTAAKTTATTAAAAATGSAEEDEPKAAAASQLVHQFATLAGKLGIHLPPSVLSTLTAAAAANEAAEPTETATATAGTNKSSFARQLQQTAEESIAAIQGRKRKASGSSGESTSAAAPSTVSPSLLPMGFGEPQADDAVS